MSGWPQISRMVVYPIKAYQKLVSPRLGRNCRYSPSCSSYVVEAVERFGVARGLMVGLKRIGRCHPLGGEGYDPVPDRRQQKLTDV